MTAMKTVIYPVKDLTAAKEMYGTFFGVAPSVDEDYYVGFEVAGQHIGLDPDGHSNGMTGPVGYWHVADISKAVRQLVDAGATMDRPIRDVGEGKLVATLRDPDGNTIGLAQDRSGGWTP